MLLSYSYRKIIEGFIPFINRQKGSVFVSSLAAIAIAR